MKKCLILLNIIFVISIFNNDSVSASNANLPGVLTNPTQSAYYVFSRNDLNRKSQFDFVSLSYENELNITIDDLLRIQED